MELKHLYLILAGMTFVTNIVVVYKLARYLRENKGAHAERPETVKVFHIPRKKTEGQDETLTLHQEDSVWKQI